MTVLRLCLISTKTDTFDFFICNLVDQLCRTCGLSVCRIKLFWNIILLEFLEEALPINSSIL